jgi:hypothetical protein
MFGRPPSPGTAGGPADTGQLTPEEEEAFQRGLDRIALEKQRALEDPGPSWREWFFHDHAKWWVGLGFLIVDVFLGASWFTDGAFSALRVAGAIGCLAPAVYLEVLGWRYLWRHPKEGDSATGQPFRRSWKSLRQVGRWTPEAERLRASGRNDIAMNDGTAHPEDFL